MSRKKQQAATCGPQRPCTMSRIAATIKAWKCSTQFMEGPAMKVASACLVGLVIAVVAVQGQEGDKKPGIGALPPHPLDGAFEKVRTETDIKNKLLNNELYKKAVKEALKAYQDQEAKFKKDAKFVGPSPAQAARVTFLEVLVAEMKGEKNPEKQE